MMRVLRIFALLLFATTTWAQAPSAPLPAITPEMDQRLKLLETELRCLVCQNQTLADSPAGLADDLRREIRTLANAGKSNAEIKAFLQARYGDFVLYRPPVKSSTWLLWGGPFALLGLGGVIFFRLVLRRRKFFEEIPPEDSSQARQLLDTSDS